MKTKIINMSYNAMFRAVFSNNKYLLSKLVKAILDYYKIDIPINENDLILKKNELDTNNFYEKQLICDYIVRINDSFDLNIEINREKYLGLKERNLTYSFKIYGSHFKSGDDYSKFNSYTMLQVNYNTFRNSNGKCVNCFYMIDVDDIKNRLTSNFSILNIDIASCYNLVYNNNNLEEILPIHAFGAMMYCNYLEEISSILERGIIDMDNEEKTKFLNDVKEKSQDKEIEEVIRLESSIEERFNWIEAIARAETRKEVTKDIIKPMLKKGLSYEDISDISKCTIEEIKKMANEVGISEISD